MTTMRPVLASKENAHKAHKLAKEIADAGIIYTTDMNFVLVFLKAACKRLPSEAAIQRDRQRKRTKSA